MREFLEENYNEDVAASNEDTIKLAIRALLEVVQSGSKSMEVAVMRKKQPYQLEVSQWYIQLNATPDNFFAVYVGLTRSMTRIR